MAAIFAPIDQRIIGQEIATTIEPAFSQPFSIQVLERAVSIIAMLRTCSDIFSKAGHTAVSHISAKTKSPAWMLMTSGSTIVCYFFVILMNKLFDRAIQVEQWQFT
ncbi:hypothetical protein [Limosilactobacillus allomucosae]|uniref:hypothetical protein n=1 Tax=Limosilactobacillus allomucosae TaxID=3142938 RepID=UPI00326724DE